MGDLELTAVDVGHESRGEDGWHVYLRIRFPEAEAISHVAPETARAIAAALEHQAEHAEAHNSGWPCEVCDAD